MGAKSWMLTYSEGTPRAALTRRPTVNESETDALVRRLFGRDEPQRVGVTDLFGTDPPDKEIVAGVFPGVTVIAAKEFGLDNPSKLERRFIDEATASSIHLHAMHSVVDWFAYAVWTDGRLTRALSLSPDFGVIEDVGERLPFEQPYWSGEHPASDDDEDEGPVPFHPLDLAEVTLDRLFGFTLEGLPSQPSVEPDDIRLLRYRRTRPWWRFW